MEIHQIRYQCDTIKTQMRRRKNSSSERSGKITFEGWRWRRRTWRWERELRLGFQREKGCSNFVECRTYDVVDWDKFWPFIRCECIPFYPPTPSLNALFEIWFFFFFLENKKNPIFLSHVSTNIFLLNAFNLY